MYSLEQIGASSSAIAAAASQAIAATQVGENKYSPEIENKSSRLKLNKSPAGAGAAELQPEGLL